MTPEALQELKTLHAKATPGPWECSEHGGCFYVFGPDSAMVADNHDEEGWVPTEVVARMRGTGRGASDEEKKANGDLISLLRNHAAELIAAAEGFQSAKTHHDHACTTCKGMSEDWNYWRKLVTEFEEKNDALEAERDRLKQQLQERA